MRTFAYLLASIISLNSAIADTSPIKLVGRGIKDRKTGTTIAFRCVGRSTSTEVSCNSIQLVRLEENGDTIAIASAKTVGRDGAEPSESELRTHLTNFSNGYREFKNDWNSNRRKTRFAGLSAVTLIGMGAYFNHRAFEPSTGIIFVASSLAAGTLWILASSDKELFPEVNMVTTAFDDKSGWNWSTKPKKISHRNFGLLEEYVRSLDMGTQN